MSQDDRVPQPTVIHGVDELLALPGTRLGPSRPVRVDQDQITAFAEATEDHQWIHVDRERAAAGPFGQTIAHGYLTLSLCSHFLDELLEVRDVSMAVNYGTDRVRFPSPAPLTRSWLRLGRCSRCRRSAARFSRRSASRSRSRRRRSRPVSPTC